ncbi:hypothetical protein ACIBG0_41825 [Nocardia sp. NPDC050630]|uniref:hypothetical protein n=1 Tax=Nocardia sp. NPDC050630 TaxID=3364321 RepID=UPI00379EBA82
MSDDDIDVSGHIAALGPMPERLRDKMIAIMRGYYQKHPERIPCREADQRQ